MKIIEYFEVSDYEERLSVAFSNEKAAKEASIGTGFYGSNACVSPARLTIYDSRDEWERATHQGKYRLNMNDILEKLTEEERKYLIENGLRI